MTPSRIGGDAVHALLRAVQRRWRGRAWLQGALAALALAAAAALLLLGLDALVGLETGARAVLRWLPALLAGVALALGARTARRLGDTRRAALLVEERDPALEHLLTTALEGDLSGPTGAAFRRRAEVRARAVSPARVVPVDSGRPAGWAATGLVALGLALALHPVGLEGLRARWVHLEDGRAAGAGPGAAGAGAVADPTAPPPAFTGLALEVTPPAYTGLPVRRSDASGVVPVLPGSVLTLRVERGGGVVEADRVGMGPLRLESGAGAAVARWTVGPADRGVDLRLRPAPGADVVDRRVVALSVLEDRPPEVTLERPAADLVLAQASGTVRIAARATDDYGTGPWELHWVRSSGSGESFSFEEGTWAWDAVERRGDTLVGVLDLDVAGTGLGPGDVLHVRAEARDRNDVTGPALGVSATRLIRIADEDGLAEVTTLIGFPIERERDPVLSQRMIILLTEELIAARDTLTDERFAAQAAQIADEQDRLRERVEEVMFVREAAPDEHADDEPEPADPTRPPPALEPPGHDHDGSPIVEVNNDLVSAFNAMWDASRLLRQAEAEPSLPPQHVALDHLQALREADRVYARGRVTRPPLDLAAARGTGEVDEARPAARVRGDAAPDAAHWRGDVEAALSALGDDADAALALRLRDLAAALLGAPDGSVEAASAVARAADRVDAAEPEDARRLLAQARRALTPARSAGTGAPLPVATDAAGAAWLARRAAAPDTADARPARGAPVTPPFVFATARYGSGDWDSAPLVPSNLAHSLAQYTSLPVDGEGVIVDLSSPELLRYPFVFLTGHLPLRLDEAESENLKRYVERGGFLFIDDHNHDIDGAFHRSVLSELARIFGADALQPLPSDHALYSTFFPFEDGPPITGHELSGWGDGLIHRELFAIEQGGRIGVLYSNKDYASEWNYHAENKRFLALDNTRFGVNVLLYALTR